MGRWVHRTLTDIHSYLPYQGRADLIIKADISNVSLRIPAWVTETNSVNVMVNLNARDYEWVPNSRYINIGEVDAGDTVIVTFGVYPLPSQIKTAAIGLTHTGTINTYTTVIKGNTIVSIDPPGIYYPFFNRQFYLENDPLWVTVSRFVPQASPAPSSTPSPTPWGYKTPTPSPSNTATPIPTTTPQPCNERLWVGHSYDARLAQTRSQVIYGWYFSPYSDENGYLCDNENIAYYWGDMWEDYDNKYFGISIWSEAHIDVREGDHLQVRYDDSAVWIYFTGIENWEPARIWGEEGEMGEGGFAFYVDISGNTYFDPWCCQTAYYNSAPTPVPTPMPTPIPAYALWHMDVCTGGMIYDSGPSNHNGIIDGATWTLGLSGCALDFDGVDDYVDITNPVGLESFTLSAWIWGRELGRHQRVLNGAGAYFNFRIHSNNAYQLELWNGSSWIPATTQDVGFTTGIWQHIATTYDHSTHTVKIYVNGVESDLSISLVNAVPRSGSLRIGGYQPNEYFNGIIDEVSIYDEVLSGAEIVHLYSEGENYP